MGWNENMKHGDYDGSGREMDEEAQVRREETQEKGDEWKKRRDK